MKPKWHNLKDKAIKLRKKGFSMGTIEKKYGIARSTLSGWFKKVNLTPSQKKKLLQNSNTALVLARKKAVLWHNKGKRERIRKAEMEAIKVLESIDINNQDIIELSLAMLYWGEGNKKGGETAMGSSDPLILKFFLSVLTNIYNIKKEKIRCELNLRADQSSKKMKEFWSKELKIPIKNFKHIRKDKRTFGSKTYSYYKGVCYIRCGNIAIQRKLTYISKLFSRKTIINLGSWRRG